ncbi:MAG: hypothetical protein HY747_10250 [Elusimicrobia bacterium]|nr:hypothetical protein [Elusimicrobiota bacterium]
MSQEIFKSTDRIAHYLKLPRNAYINKAVGFFKRVHQRRLLKKKLQKESRLVAQESGSVLKEFEQFEDDIFK